MSIDQDVVGLTGHQALHNSDWVRESLLEVIDSEDVLAGVTSLAKGADQLFAQCLLSKGRSFRAVIPCLHYEEAFGDRESLLNYRRLVSLAFDVETLGYELPSESAFFAAGKRVVDRSSSLIAVWDGLPAKGLGGTADVVAYAKSLGRRIIHINCSIEEVDILASGIEGGGVRE